MTARKILFFIAGATPTVLEAAKIAQIVGDVQIRSALFDSTYGGNLEQADGLAGAIPDAYLTGLGDTVDTDLYPDGDCTENSLGVSIHVLPDVASVVNTGTIQLRVVKATLDEATGEITMTDVTAACTYVSATPAKGTVGAGTGLVTGVAAGTTNITVTYDFDGGGSETPLTAVRLVTLT